MRGKRSFLRCPFWRAARRMLGLLIALELLLAPMAAAIPSMREKGEEIKDLTPYISLVESRERSVRSLKYEIHETVEANDVWNLDPMSVFGNLVKYSTDRFLGQEGKVARFLGAGDSASSSLVRSQVYWNGKTFKQYYPEDSSGILDVTPPGGATKTTFSPFDIALLKSPFSGENEPSLGRLFRNPHARLRRVVDPAGREYLLLQFESSVDLWLDPEKNLLVLWSVSYYGPETDVGHGPIPQWILEVKESKEVQPGLWLPTKWTRTRQIGPPVSREHWGKVALRETYEVTMLEVNCEIPPETFEFEFPVGLQLDNRIAGKFEYYRARPIDEPLFDKNALLAGRKTVSPDPFLTATGAGSTTNTEKAPGLWEKRRDIRVGAQPIAPAARVGVFDVLWRVLIGVAALSVLLGVWMVARKRGRNAGGPADRT